jgi:hypothetical protein
MQLYFVTRRDAIKYLMAIRSEAGTNRHSAVLVNTHLHEFGADAVERVLLDVRAGRERALDYHTVRPLERLGWSGEARRYERLVLSELAEGCHRALYFRGPRIPVVQPDVVAKFTAG